MLQFSHERGAGTKLSNVVKFSFFCISNRPCLLLEVRTGVPGYRAPRFTSHQQINGQQEETFPGENICQIIWIHHRYHCNCHYHNQLFSDNDNIIFESIICKTINDHGGNNIKTTMITPVQMPFDVRTFNAEWFFPRARGSLRAAHVNQQILVTGGKGDDFKKRDEVLCGILQLIVFYLAFVSRCFSTMLRQERGEKLGNFKSSEWTMPSL